MFMLKSTEQKISVLKLALRFDDVPQNMAAAATMANIYNTQNESKRLSKVQELKLLSPLQISNLISYRNLLGHLINIYELQSIPGWDVSLIKLIRPYVTVSNKVDVFKGLGSRLKNGENTLLIRGTQVLEKSRPRNERMNGEKIECNACPVLCQISDGRSGACDRYANHGGTLIRVDPVLLLRRNIDAH